VLPGATCWCCWLPTWYDWTAKKEPLEKSAAENTAKKLRKGTSKKISDAPWLARPIS
jgi:hypothetical protein